MSMLLLLAARQQLAASNYMLATKKNFPNVIACIVCITTYVALLVPLSAHPFCPVHSVSRATSSTISHCWHYIQKIIAMILSEEAASEEGEKSRSTLACYHAVAAAVVAAAELLKWQLK